MVAGLLIPSPCSSCILLTGNPDAIAPPGMHGNRCVTPMQVEQRSRGSPPASRPIPTIRTAGRCGRSYYAMGRYAEAVKAYARAVQLTSRWALRGLRRRALDEPGQAHGRPGAGTRQPGVEDRSGSRQGVGDGRERRIRSPGLPGGPTPSRASAAPGPASTRSSAAWWRSARTSDVGVAGKTAAWLVVPTATTGPCGAESAWHLRSRHPTRYSTLARAPEGPRMPLAVVKRRVRATGGVHPRRRAGNVSGDEARSFEKS